MSASAGFWLLVVTEGIMTVGHAMAFPFLAVYLSAHRHVPMAWIGLFLSLSMFVASFSQVVGGEISDAIGRRKVMTLSLALRAVFTGAMGWVILSGASLWVLFLLHPLGIFVGSFFHPAARAWVADFVVPSRRMKAYGILRIGTNAGWALGPALGGLLAGASFHEMFFIAAAVYAVCTVVIWFSVRDVPGAARSEGLGGMDFKAAAATLGDVNFRRFCLVTFIMYLVMSQLVVSSSLYSKTYLGFSEAQIGLLFSVNGAIVVLLQYFVTKVLEGRRITSGLAAGAVLYGVGYFFFGFSPGFAAAAAAMVVVTFGELAVSPGLQALGANMAPRGEKGRYLGVQGLFQQVGNATGVFLGSNAIALISPRFQQGPWVLVAFVAGIASFGFLSLGRRLTPEQNGQYSPEPPPLLQKSPETI
ncbi:MAG: MFS transporter [Elusimicrobia bacterium]|nr:MFS transporter [Elusimicrobiota bacterium]